MAEKKLRLTFDTADGHKTTMTLSNPRQDLTGDTVRAAMTAMAASGAFATTTGSRYVSARSAAYIERVETPLFDNTL